METLNISDGTTMQITRLPDIDDKTWAEVKKYVETNPDTAKAMQNFAKNPDAMRGWLQTQAIAEHYSTKLSNGDTPVQDRVKSLEKDAELGPIFEDIKKNGMEAAMKYYQDLGLLFIQSRESIGNIIMFFFNPPFGSIWDIYSYSEHIVSICFYFKVWDGNRRKPEDEELMLKISQKMGGLPSELNPVLQKIEETPMTLHEAAKRGDLAAVQSFLEKKKPLDSQVVTGGISGGCHMNGGNMK